MRLGSLLLLAAVLALAGCDGGGGKEGAAVAGGSLRLDPHNPRQLLFGGRPTVLITSAEHYGALVNAGFDYERYLDELERYGFNQTRVFSGSYVETEPSSVLGYDNSLTPRPGRFVSPWARNADGRYDLARWDPAYFDRLASLVEAARSRGVVIELVLFSATYDAGRWAISPFNPANNVARAGPAEPAALNTLDNGGALRFQDALVRKLVAELGTAPNVYFEVMNEPWEGVAPADDAWQDHVTATIAAADSKSPVRHLIARNYPGDQPVTDPSAAVSIFNFHYQRDIREFRDLEGVIAFDETGFQGTGDVPYRRDAWLFMLAGGGIYSNLDWSFTPGREGGTFSLPAGTPGGGGESLRRSLAVLKRFLERLGVGQLAPAPALVHGAPKGAEVGAMADPGRAYAVYLSAGGAGPLTLDVAPGSYEVNWVDPRDGSVTGARAVEHTGGELRLAVPAHPEDIALSLVAR